MTDYSVAVQWLSRKTGRITEVMASPFTPDQINEILNSNTLSPLWDGFRTRIMEHEGMALSPAPMEVRAWQRGTTLYMMVTPVYLQSSEAAQAEHQGSLDLSSGSVQ